MNLFDSNTWDAKLQPVIDLYRGKKHPLEYEDLYQLIVMVVLSAQDSDANINKIAPALFQKYPDFESLSTASFETLFPLVNKVRNFNTKSSWLLEIAKTLKSVDNIPTTLPELNRFSQ